MFLEELGMDFGGYNDFAANYVPQSYRADDLLSDLEDTRDLPPTDDTDRPTDYTDDTRPPSEKPPSNTYDFDWSNVPPELIPLIEQLLGKKKP